MGIGTSDGRYYPTEMEQTLHELPSEQEMFLHMVPEGERYDDTPTPQQRALDGSIFNSLKLEEKDMEDRLNDPNITWENVQPTPITPVSDLPVKSRPVVPSEDYGYSQMSGELAKLPRITVTPNEPEKVVASDKRGFWNQITGADGQPRYRLFPERILDHMVESADRYGKLLKGEAQLPSKGGVPGAAEADDPEAIRNLGAVTDMAGFLILGPGRDAALQASPVTFQKAEQSLASIERITPESSRGGVEILGSHTHPDPRTLEEQLAEIMRPRSRAEAAAADSTQSYVRQPRRPTNLSSDIDRTMQEIADSLRLSPTQSPSETYTRYLRESGVNSQYPRGWQQVEGGPSLSSLPSMQTKTITFANKDGQKFYLEATQYGDHIGVGMIGSLTTDGLKLGIDTKFANTMGVRGMRDVLKKVREEFPDAKTISGFRITGARKANSGGGGRATVKLPDK